MHYSKEGYYGSSVVEPDGDFQTNVDSSVVGYTVRKRDGDGLLRIGLVHARNMRGRSYIDIRAVTPMSSTPITLDSINRLQRLNSRDGSKTWWVVDKVAGNSPAIDSHIVQNNLLEMAIKHDVAHEVLVEHLRSAMMAVLARQARVDYTLVLLQGIDAKDESSGATSFVEMDDGDLGIRFIGSDKRKGVVSVATMNHVVMDDGLQPPDDFSFDLLYEEAMRNFSVPAKEALVNYFTAKKTLLQSIYDNLKSEYQRATEEDSENSKEVYGGKP